MTSVKVKLPFLKITTAHFEHKLGLSGVYDLIPFLPHPNLTLSRIVQEVVQLSLPTFFLLIFYSLEWY